jgi:hypothetical protein
MRQEMIFDARERAILEGLACLRSYSGIKRQQLTGLLAALGEYAILTSLRTRFAPCCVENRAGSDARIRGVLRDVDAHITHS